MLTLMLEAASDQRCVAPVHAVLEREGFFFFFSFTTLRIGLEKRIGFLGLF